MELIKMIQKRLLIIMLKFVDMDKKCEVNLNHHFAFYFFWIFFFIQQEC